MKGFFRNPKKGKSRMGSDKVWGNKKPQGGGGKTAQGAALGAGTTESGKPQRGGPKMVRRLA